MTAAIKRMLAERAKLEADRAANAKLERKWERLSNEMLAMVDKAAPFIDEGCDPTKWPPSAKLKLTYFIAATSPYPGGEKRALLFVLKMLERGRRLWIEGLHPDPWAENPKVRL